MQTDVDKRTAPVPVIVGVFLAKSQLPRDILNGAYCPRPMARRRHELMWLLQRLTYLGLNQIGAVVGGLDPTTVRAGIGGISDRMPFDPNLRQRLLEIEAACFAESGSLLSEARKAVGADVPSSGRSMAVTLLSVASVLASPHLTDAEARRAALDLIERDSEVRT